MTRNIETAVILAAGLGSRLGDLKKNKPKAFIEIGNESLINRSIRLLLSKGIKKIIIGTGYGSDHFDELKEIYPQVSTHRNPKFDTTGSMYTLHFLRDLIKGPFLLLEGDLLYSDEALDKLIQDDREDIILASDATHSGDEVFIQHGKENLLEKMSKDKGQLHHVDGELVGISKLSLTTLSLLSKFAEASYQKDEYDIHYEDAFVGITKNTTLFVKVIENLAWCEIDDASHLERAKSIVYPKILKQQRN